MSEGTRDGGMPADDGAEPSEAGAETGEAGPAVEVDRDQNGVLGVEVDPDADGPTAFMQALRVPRNARWGAVVGVGFTLLVFVFFVVIPGTDRASLWYVGLAFVLALSTAGLVAALLTIRRAVRLSRDL